MLPYNDRICDWYGKCFVHSGGIKMFIKYLINACDSLIAENGVTKTVSSVAVGAAGGFILTVIMLNVLPSNPKIITENTIEKENWL